MSDRARAFGRLYAELSGEGPRDASVSAQRARLLMAVRNGSIRSSSRRKTWGLVAASAFAATAIALATSSFGSDELEVHLHGTLLAENAALVADEATELPLQFSDGSRIVLEPLAKASVGTIANDRADVTLEHGRISARIQAATGVDWTIGAGPYRVHVTGTQFTVDWSRSAGFRVAVAQGSVRVTGGDLPSNGVFVHAGEQLSRLAKESSPTAALAGEAQSDAAEDPSQATDEASLPGAAEQRGAQQAIVQPRASVRATARSLEESEPPAGGAVAEPAAPSWLEFASNGSYSEAVQAAERQGFDQLVTTATQSDLLLLANSARYVRNGHRAKQAYTAIRQRFPGSNAARLSAFYLARLAGDVEGQPRAEASWLRTYLAESPSGELAGSARARLMETLRASGDLVGAKSVAKDYLKYHPQGPHAAVARSILRNTGQP